MRYQIEVYLNGGFLFATDPNKLKDYDRAHALYRILTSRLPVQAGFRLKLITLQFETLHNQSTIKERNNNEKSTS